MYYYLIANIEMMCKVVNWYFKKTKLSYLKVKKSLLLLMFEKIVSIRKQLNVQIYSRIHRLFN